MSRKQIKFNKKVKKNITLVAFGDSFVEGFIKSPKENTKKDREKINFITKLCTLDNPFVKCENYGIHGASNEKIAYRVYKRCKSSVQNCFFLICWSHHDRVSYFHHANDEYQTDINLLKATRKNNTFQTTMFMFGLHNMLTYLQIPHAQINSFSPLIKNHKLDYAVAANYINAEYDRNTLFDIIANRYKKEIPLRHDDYSHPENFDFEFNDYITKCYHPTASGHTLIAKTLNTLLKRYYELHFSR